MEGYTSFHTTESTTVSNHMEESQKQKKSDTKECKKYDYIHIKFKIRQS